MKYWWHNQHTTHFIVFWFELNEQDYNWFNVVWKQTLFDTNILRACLQFSLNWKHRHNNQCKRAYIFICNSDIAPVHTSSMVFFVVKGYFCNICPIKLMRWSQSLISNKGWAKKITLQAVLMRFEAFTTCSGIPCSLFFLDSLPKLKWDVLYTRAQVFT